jgi:8-oxo-dGTP pyrophosphatase MutT (NUDIX family)
VEIVEKDLVRVEYKVGEDWYGKVVHSEDLSIPDPSEELERHLGHKSGAPPVDSSDEVVEHDPGAAYVRAYVKNAHIILTDGKGKIFLLRSSKNKKWGYPGGGFEEKPTEKWFLIASKWVRKEWPADQSGCKHKGVDAVAENTMRREFEQETGVPLPEPFIMRKLCGGTEKKPLHGTVIFVGLVDLVKLKSDLKAAPSEWSGKLPVTSDGENDRWMIDDVDKCLAELQLRHDCYYRTIKEAKDKGFSLICDK